VLPALLPAACADLVGIEELPGLPDGGANESGGPDVTRSDGGPDSHHETDASSRDASADVRADVLDGRTPLENFPSHTQPMFYEPDAGALTGITAIDTAALTLNGTSTLPPGVQFAYDDSATNAVLSVGTWDVASKVSVIGGPPLIVVAAGAVTVDAEIDGAGMGATAGPGAITSKLNPAVGTPGCLSPGAGGQGGGFGTAGGFGGSYAPPCTMSGGQIFGAALANFSGGGSGGGGDDDTCGGSHSGLGGGGGGAIQISSAVSITIGSSGGVNVGGGGGQGGCPGGYTGGGGGAGGEIFLEAPTITVMAHGILSANGGGGGTGDDPGGAGGDSLPGADGQFSSTPAEGGAGSLYLAQGGAGAAGDAAATAGSNLNGSPSGGGGGLGRIWFRTRTALATTTGATISGVQSHDTSL
jgi:hypothetical protein